jgi:hypothetical protein
MWLQNQDTVDPTAVQPLLEEMPLVDYTFNDPPKNSSFPITANSSTPSEPSSLSNTHWTPWDTKPSFPYSTNFGGGNIPVKGQLYHDFGSSAFNFDISQLPVPTDTVANQVSALALPTGAIHDDTLLDFQRHFTASGTSGSLPPQILNDTIPESILPLERSETFTAPGASSTISEPLPLTVNHPVSLMDNTIHPIQEDAATKNSDKENRSTRVRKPTTSKQMPHIWRDQAYRYFLVDLEDDNWKDCVEKWLAFEEGTSDTTSVGYFYSTGGLIFTESSTQYRMGVKSRPPLFLKWVGNRNFNALPQIPDYTTLQTIGLDGGTRYNRSGDRTLQTEYLSTSRAESPRTACQSVRKGGPSGLVTLLIGLKWWAGIRDSDPRWGLAVLDFTACLTSFITCNDKAQGKLMMLRRGR